MDSDRCHNHVYHFTIARVPEITQEQLLTPKNFTIIIDIVEIN